MPDRLQLPPERDFGFYQRRKHDAWREVPPPAPPLEAPVVDSHAHIHMLPDPAWELARCAANGVDYACMIVDPSEDGPAPFDDLDTWLYDAAAHLADVFEREMTEIGTCARFNREEPVSDSAFSQVADFEKLPEAASARAQTPIPVDSPGKTTAPIAHVAASTSQASLAVPTVAIAVGVHPHNARLYDAAMEDEMLDRLEDPRVVTLGEIGLDFHYDLSPRDVQAGVFRRQVELAKQASLPIVLHLRGGEDLEADNAHAQALAILQEVGFPERGTLLHCCALPPEELRPWVEAGCYIAYGGALTFKNADAAREGALLVPDDRLMLETDAPYMTPEPMRGTACTPAHVVFTATALAELRGHAPGLDRQAFLEQLHANTLRFFS